MGLGRGLDLFVQDAGTDLRVSEVRLQTDTKNMLGWVGTQFFLRNLYIDMKGETLSPKRPLKELVGHAELDFP